MANNIFSRPHIAPARSPLEAYKDALGRIQYWTEQFSKSRDRVPAMEFIIIEELRFHVASLRLPNGLAPEASSQLSEAFAALRAHCLLDTSKQRIDVAITQIAKTYQNPR